MNDERKFSPDNLKPELDEEGIDLAKEMPLSGREEEMDFSKEERGTLFHQRINKLMEEMQKIAAENNALADAVKNILADLDRIKESYDDAYLYSMEEKENVCWAVLKLWEKADLKEKIAMHARLREQYTNSMPDFLDEEVIKAMEGGPEGEDEEPKVLH